MDGTANQPQARLVAAIAVACALAGCTAAADRSGAPPEPTVLVLANNDGDLTGAPPVAHFVDLVGELSGGRLIVTVSSLWKGGGDEPGVIRDVAAGEADLGWSGTRAFDMTGVDSFQPLHAPFLVDTYAAESAVVTDPIAQEMLADLEPIGLTGIALAADELRMPAGAAKPLLAPADFAGLLFGTPPSQVQFDGVTALGGNPVPLTTPRPPTTNGLGGLDTMWSTYLATGQSAVVPFVTHNAVLWPRTVAVFANEAALDGLEPEQRGWIEQAGSDTATWSAARAGERETDEIVRACRAGTRIATATAAQLDALRAAAEPVYTALRADPTNGARLVRIETLVRSAPVPPATEIPADCGYQPGQRAGRPTPVSALTGPGQIGSLPVGVYRYSLKYDELIALGHSVHDARINAGIFTWILREGNWEYAWQPELSGVTGAGAATSCEGWYDVTGETVMWTMTTRQVDGECAPPTWSARWHDADGFVTWREVSVTDYYDFFAGQPWRRIG